MLSKSTKYLSILDKNGNLVEWKKTIFLKHFITKNFIEVGDYTYYDATYSDENPEDFENNNILYVGVDDKLIVGKFCCIANGCKFILNGANHHFNACTAYPLFWNKIYDDKVKSFAEVIPDEKYYPKKKDTVIGNDVWLGYDATIMPGVKIGDGAVVGAKSVVTKDVAPYTIVAGNPAKVIRKRFDDKTIEKLLKVQWWDWEMKKIMENYENILEGNLF